MSDNVGKETGETQIVITVTAKHVITALVTFIGTLIGTLITIFMVIWLNVPLKSDVAQLATKDEMRAGFNTINAKLDAIIQRLDSHEKRIADNEERHHKHVLEYHAGKD